MIDNRPLQNPEIADLPIEGTEELTVVPATPPTPSQVPLGLESSWRERLRSSWADLFGKAKKREVEIEMVPFLRNAAAPFAIVTSLIVVLGLFVTGFLLFNSFPPQIPFFYNGAEGRWEQVDKSVMLFVPIMLFLFEAALLRIIYAVFFYDRRLSIMLSWTLTIVNFLILVAAIELHALRT